MKKLLYTLAALLVSNFVLAQSGNKNYVKTTSFSQPVKNQAEIDALPDYDKSESIIYYDGLGRPEQKIIYRSGGGSSVSQNNFLINDWSTGGYSSSFYRPSGQVGENDVVDGVSPFGDASVLWECNNDAARNADGGWNTAYLGIDNTKTYRYTVWVKRTGNVANGRTYHGTRNVNNLSGTSNSNPYFFAGNLPQANKWYLMVGIIHPHNFSGTTSTGESGVYDMQGNKVKPGNEFKWRSNTTYSNFRSYLYYCTDTTAKQYFWNPVLQEFNGEEFTLAEIQNTDQVLSSGSKDIVVPIKYDDYGRQDKDYLPVPVSGTDGLFRANDLVINDSENYYLNHFEEDLNPSAVNVFSQKSLEASPLNRLLEQAAPGESWRLNSTSDTDNTIKFDYQTNTATEVSQFSVNFLQGNPATPQLVYTTKFGANQLYKNITKDENWKPSDLKNHTTEEFKNKQGQVVLKRTYNQNQKHDTYYIYDHFGNLTYVLSPEGTQAIENASNSISPTVLNNLCYQYKYDYRNRLINKKIPGKGWESIIYDNLDRPILTQDALQASKSPKEWLFTKYDAFGRVTYTGMYKNNGTRDGLQIAVKNHASNNSSLLYEDRKTSAASPDASTNLYYTNRAFPTNPAKIYTINYYDDYNWDTGNDLEASYDFGNPSTLTKSNASYTKPSSSSASWNAGFISSKTIMGDGYISFKAAQLNKRVMVGLTSSSSPNSNTHYSIDFAIHLGYQGNRVIASESGTWKSMGVVTYEVGDVFKVERSGSQILYKKNDEVFYISSAVSAVSLKGDSSFFDPGTRIDNVFIGHSQEGQAFTSQTKTLSTGSKVRVLETNNWTTTVSYYDEKARPIYSTSNNTYLQVNEAVTSKIDFSGKVQKTHHTHIRDKDAPIVTVDEFTYDHAGRLLTQQQQINKFDKELLVKNSYDDLGQLVKKQVGGKIQESNSYSNVSNNLEVIGNSITKKDTDTTYYAWDAGLSTTQSIPGDGYLSYTIPKHNKYLMVGLTYADINQSYNYIHYAIYHNNGIVKIYELGSNIGVKTTYVINDSFKIERRGQTIHYIKNGEVFYTSQVPSSAGALIGDISMHSKGAQINDLVIAGLENGLQDVDYDYNIRGWLKQINDVDNMSDDLFSFKLNYNTSDYGATTLFNGNISETIWKTANDNKDRAYTYNYDALNRITNADYHGSYGLVANLGKIEDYSMSISGYDKNGNITGLRRVGLIELQNNIDLIDVLDYTYAPLSNQLEKVNDNAGIDGFKDGQNTGSDYQYDINGNMVKDLNKGIQDISYNHLNLPVTVSIESGEDNEGKIYYIYDATGVKLRKVVDNVHSNDVKATMYAGNFIYEDHEDQIMLKFFSHTEGYIQQKVEGKLDKGIDYVYQFKDHLGNIRLAYSDMDDSGDIDVKSEIIEENNYYPFGLKHKGYNNVVSSFGDHPYGYNGKEEQNELGLNWLDYGARNYDPSLGRFMNVDLLAEINQKEFSPYSYVKNNPIKFTDPSGMIWEDPSKAEDLKKSIRETKAGVQKEINRLQGKINSGKLSERSIANKKERISNMNTRIKRMDGSIKDIDALGADKNNTFNLVNGGETNFVEKRSDGVINIEGPNNALHIHEVKHVALALGSSDGLQFSSKNLLMPALSRDGKLDEIEGYGAQWAYKPSSVPGSVSAGGNINWTTLAHLTTEDGNYVYPALRQKLLNYNKQMKISKKMNKQREKNEKNNN
ncbi:DUF6443 domain-containing protein [Olleya namhaensis]|nr:DUF6443 domain-containing protein [Olleya namhaensis]